jgi:hypothetical protein
MNVKRVNILGYTFKVEDKELVDPKLIEIKAINPRTKW